MLAASRLLRDGLQNFTLMSNRITTASRYQFMAAVLAMGVVVLMVIVWPQLALWLPRALGF